MPRIRIKNISPNTITFGSSIGTILAGDVETKDISAAQFEDLSDALLRLQRSNLIQWSLEQSTEPDENLTEFFPVGASATKTQGPLILWVDAANGNDTNDGLSSSKALATLVEAESRIPDIVIHNVLIHVAPHTGDGYAPPTFRERILRANIDVIADSGGTQDDGFNELYVGVAQPGTAITGLVALAGLGVNTYRGKTVEMTSDAQVGARKTIADHTDTVIEPCVLWPPSSVVPAIASGDTFRIIEPVTRIHVPAFGSGSSARWTFTEGQPEQHLYGATGSTTVKPTVNLINFYINTTATTALRVQLGQAVRLFGLETNKALGLVTGSATIGVDANRDDFAYMAATVGTRVAGVSAEAWVGWGLTCGTGFLPSNMIRLQGHGIVATRAIFYQCASAEVSGVNFHTLGVQVFGDSSGAGRVRLHGNYYGTSSRQRVTNTTGVALEVRGGDANCSVTKTRLTASSQAVLATEGGSIDLIDNIDVVAVTGAKARYGGKVRFRNGAFESLTISGNQLEAGNTPATSTIAALNAAGTYISEADGSVIQRIT